MTDPTAPEGNAASAPAEAQADEKAIRERVRELTAQMLAGGRLDTEGVKEVVRTMSGGVSKPPLESVQAREAFAEAIRGLDEALHASSLVTHAALQALVARGKEFSDNDLKNAFTQPCRYSSRTTLRSQTGLPMPPPATCAVNSSISRCMRSVSAQMPACASHR